MSNKKFSTSGFIGIIVVVILLLAFLFLNPLYTVEENEAAIITRLGEIRKVETEAGLHFRVPFIDNIHKYSRRVLRIDGDPQKIPTRENQFIEVDTTSRWHITDVAKFYKSLGTYETALSKISDIVDSSCRDVVSVNGFDSIVRSSNIINEIDSSEELNLETDDVDTSNLLASTQKKQYVKITIGREEVADDIKERANAQLNGFGIELIDVIFKSIKYADELQESVFSRMITERNKIASTIRSTGEGKKAEVLGQLENEKQSILSKAYAESEAIKGQADAEAAALYAAAYNKDAEFYAFWKSMESYRKTLPTIEKLMSTDSEFFKHLTRP